MSEQCKDTISGMEMLHDGTLHITVDHDISNVYRVWLSQKGTHYGELYYPDYTDEEIQKMQDLEQTQLDKAYEIGIQSAQHEVIRCKDCKHSEHWYRDKRRCFLWVEDGIDVFDDGFCNYAEVKNVENSY